MVAELVMSAVVVVATGAELMHARRVARLALLAFGPLGRPGLLGRCSPFLRVLALGTTSWGLTTLLLLPPRVQGGTEIKIGDRHHLVLVLDVSPSMRLKDAGATRNQMRNARAADLLESLFARVPMSQFRTTIIAVYNGAKPVVVDTTDGEVVWNVLRDLPMHYAFPAGKTRLFDGLTEAAKIAQPWSPRTASLLLMTDGDTVPASDMPRMPPSVASVLVVGVGDTKAGTFIDGKQSRQDVATLRQLAVRLQGSYHDGNEKQLPSDLAFSLLPVSETGILDRLTKREYALFASGVGGLLYAILPVLLHYVGHSWRPGVPVAKNRVVSSSREFASVS